MQISDELRQSIENQCLELRNNLLARITELTDPPTSPIVGKVKVSPKAFDKFSGVTNDVEDGQ
jgi:hypothetical protein